jgi:hypothetical protein
VKYHCLVAAALTLLGSVSSARADLGWEHVGTLRFSAIKTPVMRVKMYNSWTPSRHRLLVSYSVHGAPGMNLMPPNMATFAESMPLESALGFTGAEPVAPLFRALTAAQKKSMPRSSAMPDIKNFGSFALVQNIDNDRVLAYDSQTKHYVSESRRELLRRTTFDPFKTTAPRLSREAPPEFTPEQRRRMADELGAISKPFKERLQRTYFRALTENRTVAGLAGRGYRLTQMTNLGGHKNPQWMRVNMEWWVASETEGDEAVRLYRAAARKNIEGIAWPTTSMWLREYIKLAQEPTDDVTRQARDSFMGGGSDNGGLNATPLSMAITVLPPPLQRAQTGDIRFELNLVRRDTFDVAERVFAQPAGYTRFDMQPFLKESDPFFDGSAWGKALDSMYDLMDR